MNIEEIKERHSKIGGTPWKASAYSSDYYTQGYRVKTWNDGEIASCIDEKGEVDFIANAPNDIAYLLSVIELLEQDLTYMKQYGELTNIDGKMKLCIERALQTLRNGA